MIFKDSLNSIKLILLQSFLYWLILLHIIGKHILVTDRVHPFDIGGDTGEDSGLLGIVTSHTRHETGNTMDVVFSINEAVQRATRVTLRGD